MKAVSPRYLLILLAAVLAALALWAMRPAGGGIVLSDVTAAPISGEPGAVGIFLKIANDGGADRLIAATSSAAQSATLASAPAVGLSIPAGSHPALAPDGAFIRLAGLDGALDDGRTIPVTLNFEHAGALNIRARLTDPKTKGAAGQFGLFGIGDICRVGEGEPAPAIALVATAAEDGWRIEVVAEEFTFAPDMADGPHVPGFGHGHLYLNGLKLQRLYDASAHIGQLPPGRHEVRVTLNTNDHRAYVVDDTPVTAQAMIEVR